MLEPAIKYKEELLSLFSDTWFNDKYKYYYAIGYPEMPEIENNAWNHIQMVSVYKNQILGFIEVAINRNSYIAQNTNIISFVPSIVFAKDVRQFIDKIFTQYNFHKLTFEVAIGNSVEHIYDKYKEKLGGKIVGIKEQQWKLWDNKYYDVKHYEILKSNYIKIKS